MKPPFVRITVTGEIHVGSPVPIVILILVTVYLLRFMAANPAMPHGVLWFAG